MSAKRPVTIPVSMNGWQHRLSGAFDALMTKQITAADALGLAAIAKEAHAFARTESQLLEVAINNSREFSSDFLPAIEDDKPSPLQPKRVGVINGSGR